jgi:hypothetical protein
MKISKLFLTITLASITASPVLALKPALEKQKEQQVTATSQEKNQEKSIKDKVITWIKEHKKTTALVVGVVLSEFLIRRPFMRFLYKKMINQYEQIIRNRHMQQQAVNRIMASGAQTNDEINEAWRIGTSFFVSGADKWGVPVSDDLRHFEFTFVDDEE